MERDGLIAPIVVRRSEPMLFDDLHPSVGSPLWDSPCERRSSLRIMGLRFPTHRQLWSRNDPSMCSRPVVIGYLTKSARLQTNPLISRAEACG
jgi:hypothetical protein